MDLIIFSGQSNMQGQTEGLPSPNAPVNGAWQFLYLTNELIPLKHPVGEDIQIGEESLLLGAHNGGGSLVPAFCEEYTRVSGREVIAVHAARGSTTIAQWQPETLRYQALVKKVLAAKKKAAEYQKIDKIYFVWLQGESDAIAGTSAEEYAQRLIEYKNTLKEDLGIEKFGIIKVGYFYSTSQWHTHISSYQEKKTCDENIMLGQEIAVKCDADFVILTRICTEMSLNPAYINPKASGHYNNKAMKRIGEEAAKELYRFTKGIDKSNR